jgi:hypothetical protein
MFDIFYIGKKPNLFAHEQAVDSIQQAQQLSRTRFFWIVNYLAVLDHWDFLWEPAPWQAHQRHAWPDQHQPDSGVYLVPRTWDGQETNYHVHPRVCHRTDPEFWHMPDWIDPASIDQTWSPDSGEPPYIYEFPVEWGWDRVGGPQYHVPGATNIKYVDDFVARTQHTALPWYQHCAVEWTDDVQRWRPNPADPPYNYVFGNQWYSAEVMPTVEYCMPGAVGKKYMDLQVRLPEHHDNRWHTLYDCEWDYSWVPDPGDPPYIYVWGNQWWSAEIMPTVEYHVPGATERKYMTWPARLCKDRTNWQVPNTVDINSIDFSWQPDPGDPPYIYEFATQWQPTGGARYVVPGATEVKYVDIQHQRLSDRTNWQVPNGVDINSIDFSWHPDVTEQPYIYEFATQWQSNGGAQYTVPGATERKYVDIQHRRLADSTNWTIPDFVDVDSIDFSWHPDATEQPYIYEFATQWQSTGGARYHVPGSTEHKYVDIQHRRLADSTNWTIPDLVDANSVDTSWHPGNTEQPYIYEFATQWQPTGGAVYTVPGATERKYVEIQHRRLPDKTAWTLLEAVASFDYSWHPDNTEPPYNYVFGNQHWPATEMPTTVYKMPDAVSDKFVDVLVARLWGCMGNWELCEDIDDAAWDWSWVPNPKDPPYIYVFGNQWNPPEFKASVKYHVPGATEVKNMDRRTTRLPQPQLFAHNIAVSKFDYSWEPNPFDPPMTYVFGNQWNSAVLEPTVVYNAGGTEIKYVDDIIATVAQDVTAWELLDDIEQFDYSWRPNPKDPPYIYVFGNQWLRPEQRPALKYHVAGATEIKYMDHPQARRRGDHTRFHQHCAVEFDWSWEPDPGAPAYNYVFGNQWHSAEIMPTVEYRMPGATERKYMHEPTAKLPENPNRPWYNVVESDMDYSWVPDPGDPPYIYVFGNQWHAAEIMPTVEYRMPGATERKYMDSPVAELSADMTNWYVPEYVDVTDIDFSWQPDPGEPAYIYQFATQHQKTGGPQYRMPGATEFKYVDMMRAEVKREAVPIFEIDHLDGAAGQIPDTVRRVRYFDNYRDTLIRLAKSLVGEYEHVWVCSSICDYTNFDFSWHPETWQSTMLHVFASDKEKFGDTFYMHVPTFAERAEKKALLEWYSVNYVPRRSVPRRPMPVIQHSADSHVDAVKTTTWAGPLATFTTTDYVPGDMVTVPLWRTETKTIVPLTKGATSVIVPRIAVGDIKTQLYDYPHIDKTRRWLKDNPLDIVFISNGEPNAKSNYLQMTMYLANESKYTNRVHVVDGVNGRVAAYHAAARASTTPWFFAVFAKLEVNQMFDWTWQPDRMQQPKHYIFHARNPVNGLEYGHQAMIAYNKKLALENTGVGLDFTLDQAHEVVPILSGTANYAETPWMAWRTAFRETLKLRVSLPDVENEYRLKVWLDVDHSPDQWSRKGAEDAVEFYDSVNGDPTELKKSYEWAWLASYAFVKRSLVAN